MLAHIRQPCQPKLFLSDLGSLRIEQHYLTTRRTTLSTRPYASLLPTLWCPRVIVLASISPSIKYTKSLPISNVSPKPKGPSLWQINNSDHGSSSFTLLLNPSRGYVNDLVLSHHIFSCSQPVATTFDLSSTSLSSYCLLYFVSRLEAKETLLHFQQLGHVLPTRIWAKPICAHTNRRRPENDPVHPSA